MKNLRLSLLAAALLMAATSVHAQDDAAAPAPGAADQGAISNAAPAPGTDTSTVETQVTVETEVPQQDVLLEAEPAPTTEMPDTGGAPLLMSLAGLAMAGAAFGFRRRVS